MACGTCVKNFPLCTCISWLIFLVLFVFIAVYNAGRNNFNTYSFEYSLRTLYIDEEWDDRQHFGFGDVANIEEWYGFVKNAALPGLYFDAPSYDDADGNHAAVQRDENTTYPWGKAHRTREPEAV